MNIWDTYSVKEAMRKLQQQKYRQGERNAQDNNGNQIYVLTDEDKIQCLPKSHQWEYRQQLERRKKLDTWAAPYVFDLQVTTTEYILTMKGHPQLSAGVGFSRKIISIRDVTNSPDQEQFFLETINKMKRELGWKASVPKIDLSVPLTVPEIKSLDEIRAEMVKRGQENPVMASKKKPQVPRCPEHGSVMEPREAGVLGCPILDCAVELRKKPHTGEAFKRKGDTVPLSESDPDYIAKAAAEANAVTQANVDRILGVDGDVVVSAAPIPVGILNPGDVAGKRMQGFNGQGVSQVYQVNDNFPELVVRDSVDGTRTFIRQQVDGGYVYIDLSTVNPIFSVKRSFGGLTECELVINPRPV